LSRTLFVRIIAPLRAEFAFGKEQHKGWHYNPLKSENEPLKKLINSFGDMAQAN